MQHHATMDPRVHREGQMFLQMHRQMVRDLEQNLNLRGLPLPTWTPATPIPLEFSGVEPDQLGRPRPVLQNLAPFAPIPPQLLPQRVRQYRTEQDLGNAIIPWHNAVHTRVGGSMTRIDLAPAATIFWCWHAYVDDIYEFWKRR